MNKSLNDVKWKEFNITDLFELQLSTGDNQARLLPDGNIPLVSAGTSSNAVCKFIKHNDKKSQLFQRNIITIDMFGKTFYQPYQFYAVSHGRINILIPKMKFNKFIGLYIVQSCETRFKNKYSYSILCNQTRLKKEKLMLPVTSLGEPDYKFMEEYIKEKENALKKQYKKYVEKNLVADAELPDKPYGWKEFFISELFENIQRGKRLTKKNQCKGDIPYASSSNQNNGIDNFINNKEKVRKYKNCLSLANSGSVGTCFYEPFEFIASDHITHLKGNYSKHMYLFISCIMSRLSEKYNFNREINDPRIKREKIILPITPDGTPDYDYMENYMKYLEQEKLKKYLDYIK